MRRDTRKTAMPKRSELNPITLSEEEAIPLLQNAPVIGGHRMHYGSNYTFLLALEAGKGTYLRSIYKPQAGERPLYDFPQGTLYKREYATFLLSRALGWPNVPITLIRDGPHGVGMFQLYIEADPYLTYFELSEEHRETFQKFAVFDFLVNNADRKGGHCLLGSDGLVWSIDHGLTFHELLKVRSVMLEFWGTEIPLSLLQDLEEFRSHLSVGAELTRKLQEFLTDAEMDSLGQRLEFLLREGVYPVLDPGSDIPWPPV